MLYLTAAPDLRLLTLLLSSTGRPFPLDICSVTQGRERYFSFLSQAYGLMADVDLGTEHMR